MREPFPVDLLQQSKAVCIRQPAIAIYGTSLQQKAGQSSGLSWESRRAGVLVPEVRKRRASVQRRWRRGDEERDVEGFALGLVMDFFGAGTEEGGAVVLVVVVVSREF